jgi:hypothetical protein
VGEIRGGGPRWNKRADARARRLAAICVAPRELVKRYDYKLLGRSSSVAGRATKQRASCKAQIHQPKPYLVVCLLGGQPFGGNNRGKLAQSQLISTSLDVLLQEQRHDVLRSGALDVSQIALPSSGAIRVLHNLVTWKVIYIGMRIGPLLGDCS